ncbi:MAG: hypothetical protein ACI977_000364 [Candidatus Nanohaloarchaea archaeon]|jgi:hypothetical protein
MAHRIDTDPLENYSNRVDLYELDGELNGFDYGASGEVESLDDIEDLENLGEVQVDRGSETYRGVEVQVVFTDDHYDRVGEKLF